jgi:hypothetical protein
VKVAGSSPVAGASGKNEKMFSSLALARAVGVSLQTIANGLLARQDRLVS